MLKPKYRTLSESVSDFNRMLEGMNDVQPLERQELERQVRDRQEEERLRRELAHVENVISGSSHFFTEREKAEWYTKRAKIAEMLGEEPAAIEESAPIIGGDPARNSQYRSRGSAMERFRVLAGLEEQVAMPRDAGLAGTTRHNADYAQMSEGGGSRARKGERQAGQYAGAYGPPKDKETSVWDRKKVKKAYKGYSDDDKASAKKHMRKGVDRNPGDSLGRYGSGGKLYKHMGDILKRKKREGQPVSKEAKKKLLKGFGDLDHGKPKLPK